MASTGELMVRVLRLTQTPQLTDSTLSCENLHVSVCDQRTVGTSEPPRMAHSNWSTLASIRPLSGNTKTLHSAASHRFGYTRTRNFSMLGYSSHTTTIDSATPSDGSKIHWKKNRETSHNAINLSHSFKLILKFYL